MFSTPASLSASASPSLAQQTPTAPAAVCSRAIAAHLCVLACGRSVSPAAFANVAIAAMFRSSASTSMISAGVFRSRRDPWRPIRCWWRVVACMETPDFERAATPSPLSSRT